MKAYVHKTKRSQIRTMNNEEDRENRYGRNSSSAQTMFGGASKGMDVPETSENAIHDGETKISEGDWRRGLSVNSIVDVLEPRGDGVGKIFWSPGLVLRTDANRLRVTFTDWADQWDEWIDRYSRRLAPVGTHVYLGRRKSRLQVGQRIDAYDNHPRFDRYVEASVVALREGEAKIHFEGYKSKFDEWITVNSQRIRPFKHNRRPRKFIALEEETGATKRPPLGDLNNTTTRRVPHQNNKRSSNSLDRSGKRQLSSRDPRFLHFQRALQRLGLQIKTSRGDGNCLFRSIADQVYGDDSKESRDDGPAYQCVRQCAVRYMQSQRGHFEPFISGLRIGASPNQAATDDNSNESKRSDESTIRGVSFDAYIREMSCDGTWGDDPEITAMCELYDRPAEIYVYDSRQGAKLLKTFHESRRSSRVPMRLSYYGGGHYDSIVPIASDVPRSLLSTPPGDYEKRRIDLLAAQTAVGGGTLSTEVETIRRLMALTRDEYDSRIDLDVALANSLRETEEHDLEAARNASIAALSADMENRRQLEEAKRMSLATTAAEAVAATTTTGTKATTKFDEDTEAAKRVSLAAISSGGGSDTEEDMLAAAIAMSTQKDVGSDNAANASQLAMISGKPLEKCIRALKQNKGDFNNALTWLLDTNNFGE